MSRRWIAFVAALGALACADQGPEGRLPTVPVAELATVQAAAVVVEAADGPRLVVRLSGAPVGAIQGVLTLPAGAVADRAMALSNDVYLNPGDRRVRFAAFTGRGAVALDLFSVPLVGGAPWSAAAVSVDVAGDVDGETMPAARIVGLRGAFRQ